MRANWLGWFFGTVAVASGIAGCGNPTASQGKVTTITFEHWRGEDVPTFNKIIAQFEKKYPNIAVHMIVLTSQNYPAQIQSTEQTADES